MKKQELVITGKSTEDARVSVVKLSSKGKQLILKIEKQYLDVTLAVEELLSETQYALWKAIEDVEFLLVDKSFFHRVQESRKIREPQHIEIIDYLPEFHEDFKRLNYEWIEQYFKLEEADLRSLERPDEKILKPGGHIYMARHNNKIVGTCALIRINKNTYELAKMAVTRAS